MEQMLRCTARPALRSGSGAIKQQSNAFEQLTSRNRSETTHTLRFLVLLLLIMISSMALSDFIKSGGWDKNKFSDATGFPNIDFKFTTRKLVQGYDKLLEPSCALNFPRRRGAILIMGNDGPRGPRGKRLAANAAKYDRLKMLAQEPRTHGLSTLLLLR